MHPQAASKTVFACQLPLLQEQEQIRAVKRALHEEDLKQPQLGPFSVSGPGLRPRQEQERARLGVVRSDVVRYHSLLLRYERLEELVRRAMQGGRLSRKFIRMARRSVFHTRRPRLPRGV